MLSQAGQVKELQPNQSKRNGDPVPSCLQHPLVSIILCTNELSPALTRCLELLTSQDCRHYETILVLNAPADEAFAQATARFRVQLLNEPRRGVCNARNHAVRHAKGDILFFVDDDITLNPDWLHRLLDGFADPHVACVTGRVIPAGPLYLDAERADRYYASERALSDWTLDASDPDWYQYILGQPVGFGCNMGFRKSFLEGCSLFPEDLGAGSLIGGGDEFYMFVQVVNHGYRIRHVPTAVVTHFFDENVQNRKLRAAQLYAGSVAFALKLFLEEKDLRYKTFKWLCSGLNRRARRCFTRKAFSSEPQELLSSGEKVRAYLKGISIFRKSRRIQHSASSQR